ncbi:PQQ-dependent sugar dehydrogenase [Terrabacter terrigena]|uniref:PQQ-dependent sugar dehydrogenase n=1 Tax=Terrabacter terrigena TaxID=574718 RepID=A0ABW3MU01_9MICO
MSRTTSLHHGRRSLSSRRTGVLIAGVAVATLAITLPQSALASGPSTPVPIGDPIGPRIQPGPVQVDLTTVTTGVTAPLAGITAPGRPDELFVVDQVGTLWSLDLTTPAPVTPTSVLDVSALLAGPQDPKDERGFLGAAFSPSFATDGLVYTDTSEATSPADHPLRPSTDACLAGFPQTPDHVDVIREWHLVTDSGGALHLDPAAPVGRKLLSSEHPQANHNAGDMHFGPDGFLYVTDGDGGGADDQNCQTNFDGNPMFGHPGGGNGQSLDTPLGKMLRINPRTADPRGTLSANGAFRIPADNPFPGGAVPEIYSYGLRNPFRFSFDKANGNLWVGDVGQNDIEEVDLVTAPGQNFGWRVKEGTFLFEPGGFQLKGSRSDAFVFARSPGSPAGITDPVAQYDHDDGTAIIGGYVYRGSSMPGLRGHYVFGDTSRRLNNGHGRLFAFDADNRSAVTADNTIVELRDGPIDFQLIGFGQDNAGELYALVFGVPGPNGTTGAVMRLSQSTP